MIDSRSTRDRLGWLTSILHRPTSIRIDASTHVDPCRSASIVDRRGDSCRSAAIHAATHVDPRRSASIRVGPCRSKSIRDRRGDSRRSASIHVDPRRSTSIRVDPRQSASIHVDPRRSTSIQVGPCRSKSIRVDPHRSASIRVDPRRSTSIQVDPLSTRRLTSIGVDRRRSVSIHVDPRRSTLICIDLCCTLSVTLCHIGLFQLSTTDSLLAIWPCPKDSYCSLLPPPFTVGSLARHITRGSLLPCSSPYCHTVAQGWQLIIVLFLGSLIWTHYPAYPPAGPQQPTGSSS